MHRYDFSLPDIRRAARQLEGSVLRSPLLSFSGAGDGGIRLKAENLQPTGSFKIRGSTCAVKALSAVDLRKGVYTASAGNFGQGVALAAREAKASARVYVPENAARVKIESLKALGADVVIKSQPDWWKIMVDHHADGEDGVFLHPCSTPSVVLGNATIGVEIVEDWPEVETILVPFGGGGLVLGIALGAKAIKPDVKVIACESDAATPLGAAFRANEAVTVPFDTSTFITGMGSTSVLPDMWPHLKRWVDGVCTVPVQAAAQAVRDIALHNHMIAEGAGAVALAHALASGGKKDRIAAVVSGGNMDLAVMADLLGSAASGS